MRETQKAAVGAAAFLRCFIWGLAASIIVCLLLTALCALLMTAMDVLPSVRLILAILIGAAASIGGGFVSARLMGHHGLFCGLGAGALFLLLLAVTALLLKVPAAQAGWVKWLLMLLAGALGGCLGVGKRRRKA